MVFFCGAGISLPTGLPDFRGLVDHVYSSLHASPTRSEKAAMDRGEYDKALGLLERRFTANTVRVEVARHLSRSPDPDSLRLHRALLDVSRNPAGARLVTTNYDDNFARADGTKNLRFQSAPDLPDFSNWNSVVHLHGRLDASGAEPDLSTLVLTSSDLGKAYLRHPAWAAQFVAALMDRFTVVFVGYSLGDRVIQYLAEAVSDNPSGRPIYSLVGSENDEKREDAESTLKEHGIQPIPYDSRNAHELLLHTAEEWAALAADPHGYRVQVAVSGLSHQPDRATHDADPDRVVWALRDAAAAWPAFNRIRREPVAGLHAAAWLNEFAAGGLLGGTVNPKIHERGPAGPIITARAEHQMLQADSVSQAVTLWIETHAHAPEVFKWVIERGRNLHFELRRRLWDRLTSADDDLPEIPPRLVHLWTALLAEPPEDSEFLLRLDRILNRLADPESEATDEILLRLLRPRLGVCSGPAPYRTIAADPKEAALWECGHTEVVLGCRDEIPGWNILTELEPGRFRGFLARHAVTLTEYLKTVFVLLNRSDRIHAGLIHLELADAERAEGDRRRRRLHDIVGGWTLLIEWVQACYDSLPDTEQKKDLLRSWIASDEKMLWRLALDAVAVDDQADFDLIGGLLLRSPHGVLWDDDCVREVILVLRRAGTRGSSELQAALVDAARQVIGVDVAVDLEPSTLGPVGDRLEALEDGGTLLSPEAARILATYRKQRDRSRRSGSRVAQAISGRIRDVVTVLQEGSVDGPSFKRFAQARPVAALLVLKMLGETGEWPVDLWKRALNVTQTKIKESRSGHCLRLADLLLSIPDDLSRALHREISWIVDVLAERWPTGADTTFWNLWRLGWCNRSQDPGISSRIDALTHAMNTTAGRYAGAALKRIQEASKQTPGSISEDYLRVLDRIAGDESGFSGLLILAYRLSWLYERVPQWTEQNVLSRMRWEDGSTTDGSFERVRALWEVTAIQGPLSPDLVHALGTDLWTAVRRHKELGGGENLVRLFVYVSTSDQPGLIDEDECRELARVVVKDRPAQVGIALAGILKSGPGPVDDNWGAVVRPWLESYWPREKDLNTGESSAALVDVILETGDAFPDAVEWVNGYVAPLNDRQIGSVWHRRKVWKSHPRATLALLHRIVRRTGMDPWARSALADVLKGLREVDSSLPRDYRFVELEQRAAA